MTHDNDHIDIEFQPEPDRLYAHNRRQLSAMLDGELSPDQARFMLRRLQHDGELAACWERWQVSGDVLRGRGHALLPADFSKRVAAAITAPEGDDGVARATRHRGADTRRPHGLLRWGGGALAASVALVAMFMARPIPEPPPVQSADAMGAARQEAAVDVPRQVAVAVTGAAAGAIPDAASEVPAGAPQALDGGAVGALMAAAAPAIIAAADVPRRSDERRSSRSQAQRAALRRHEGRESVPAIAVASAPVPSASASAPARTSAAVPVDTGVFSTLAGLPVATLPEGEVLFGGPAAAARPWPRAVLPGLARQPFAAGHGLPRADAFAPFHPRLEDDRATPARQIIRPLSPGTATGAPAPGAGPDEAE